jgi:hypothetical protein
MSSAPSPSISIWLQRGGDTAARATKKRETMDMDTPDLFFIQRFLLFINVSGKAFQYA